MVCSMPGFPVLHHFPEFAQTDVHWVSDAIQPYHPLLSPCSPALGLSSIRVSELGRHDICTILWIYKIPLNCTLWNSRLYVIWISPHKKSTESMSMHPNDSLSQASATVQSRAWAHSCIHDSVPSLWMPNDITAQTKVVVQIREGV